MYHTFIFIRNFSDTLKIEKIVVTTTINESDFKVKLKFVYFEWNKQCNQTTLENIHTANHKACYIYNVYI